MAVVVCLASMVGSLVVLGLVRRDVRRLGRVQGFSLEQVVGLRAACRLAVAEAGTNPQVMVETGAAEAGLHLLISQHTFTALEAALTVTP